MTELYVGEPPQFVRPLTLRTNGRPTRLDIDEDLRAPPDPQKCHRLRDIGTGVRTLLIHNHHLPERLRDNLVVIAHTNHLPLLHHYYTHTPL